MKKAVVIGSTGMVGTQLIKQLLDNVEYTEIISLVRRSSNVNHPKLKEHIIDFDNPEGWKNLLQGDVLFSTLGTTIGQAKTKERQYEVDYTYQYIVAEIAANNGMASYVLVSSAGANEKSKAFYMNMKGKLEKAIQSLPFENITILQPGQLTGTRTHVRLAESLAVKVMKGLNAIGLFKKFQPIYAQTVAKAMVNAAHGKIKGTYTLKEVFKLAE